MKSLDSKLIIYDSNCKVCSSMRDMVAACTSIPEEKIRAYKDLDPELTRHVDPNQFKNVMALIDTTGGGTLYGAEGVAYIFSSQYRLADLLLSFRPFFRIFNFFYKTQAYNRYIIATPKSKFDCDCFPEKVVKYRISYIMLSVALSVFLTAMFGISLGNFFPGMSAAEAAGQMLLIAGTGWIVQTGIAVSLMRKKALDYLGHLGSIMVAGLLILVPWMLTHVITGLSNIYLPAVSVLISSAYMLYLHMHRCRYLQISQVWTISWFILLQTTAFVWIYVFHLK